MLLSDTTIQIVQKGELTNPRADRPIETAGLKNNSHVCSSFANFLQATAKTNSQFTMAPKKIESSNNVNPFCAEVESKLLSLSN
jgi:hypothetical protein